jgi:hypothetical protein
VIALAAAAAAKSPSAWDEPGTLGFLVVFGMAVILYFLFRSLSKHLRKINQAARAEAAQASAVQDPFGPESGPAQASADGLADGTITGQSAGRGSQPRS